MVAGRPGSGMEWAGRRGAPMILMLVLGSDADLFHIYDVLPLAISVDEVEKNPEVSVVCADVTHKVLVMPSLQSIVPEHVHGEVLRHIARPHEKYHLFEEGD